MTDPTLRCASWIALSAAALVAAGAAAPLSQSASGPPAPVRPPERRAERPKADSLSATVASADLFRPLRRPSPTPFDPTRDTPGPSESAPRPELRLLGVVIGGGARALIEGVPGASGARIVAVGDTLGGLRVTGITAHTARIVGPDTTWTLALGRRQ